MSPDASSPGASSFAWSFASSSISPTVLVAERNGRRRPTRSTSKTVGELEDETPDDEPDDEPDAEPDDEPKLEPATRETSPAQAAAAEAARSDIGPLSQAEHERLQRVINDLTAQNNVQKTALAGRDREIADLEGKIKTLNGADLPTLTIDKHVEALVALLKKVTREKQELVVEELCKQFKIDLNKLDLGEAA